MVIGAITTWQIFAFCAQTVIHRRLLFVGVRVPKWKVRATEEIQNFIELGVPLDISIFLSYHLSDVHSYWLHAWKGTYHIGNLVLRGLNDAKAWCKDNAEYEDNVWVALDNGKVIDCGIIDVMYEWSVSF